MPSQKDFPDWLKLSEESDENAKRSTEVLTGLALLFVTFVIFAVVFRLVAVLHG